MRGPALDRPEFARASRPHDRPRGGPSSIARRDPPTGIRSAVERSCRRSRQSPWLDSTDAPGRRWLSRSPGGASLTREVAAEIVERADGVPLFVEELTKAVVEAGGFGEGIQKTLAGALPSSLAVPSALHAPLMARLDRLGRGEGGRADRRRDRARVFLAAVGADRRPRRERSRSGARPSR